MNANLQAGNGVADKEFATWLQILLWMAYYGKSRGHIVRNLFAYPVI